MALTTSLTTLASKATPRNGFGGASAVWPALSSSRVTPPNPDASAEAPWATTTGGPGVGVRVGVGGVPQPPLRPRPGASRPGGAPPGTYPPVLPPSPATRPPPARGTEPAGRPPQDRFKRLARHLRRDRR